MLCLAAADVFNLKPRASAAAKQVVALAPSSMQEGRAPQEALVHNSQRALLQVAVSHSACTVPDSIACTAVNHSAVRLQCSCRGVHGAGSQCTDQKTVRRT